MLGEEGSENLRGERRICNGPRFSYSIDSDSTLIKVHSFFAIFDVKCRKNFETKKIQENQFNELMGNFSFFFLIFLIWKCVKKQVQNYKFEKLQFKKKSNLLILQKFFKKVLQFKFSKINFKKVPFKFFFYEIEKINDLKKIWNLKTNSWRYTYLINYRFP